MVPVLCRYTLSGLTRGRGWAQKGMPSSPPIGGAGGSKRVGHVERFIPPRADPLRFTRVGLPTISRVESGAFRWSDPPPPPSPPEVVLDLIPELLGEIERLRAE